jgi:hypothetical protein
MSFLLQEPALDDPEITPRFINVRDNCNSHQPGPRLQVPLSDVKGRVDGLHRATSVTATRAAIGKSRQGAQRLA